MAIHRMTADWYDACALVTAFAETSDAPRAQITKFQQTIVRLGSLLNACAFYQISDVQECDVEVIGLESFDRDSLLFMWERVDRRERTEIVLQWTQKAIVEAVKEGVVDTAAPIVTRAFQELNDGMVALSKATAISDTPIPLPYTLMIVLLLVMHSALTPLTIVSASTNMFWCAMTAFIQVFSLWVIHLIAVQIENPFGDDREDLDLPGVQNAMNSSLSNLLRPMTQTIPRLSLDLDRRSDGIRARSTLRAIGRMTTTTEISLGSLDSEDEEVVAETGCACLKTQKKEKRSRSRRTQERSTAGDNARNSGNSSNSEHRYRSSDLSHNEVDVASLEPSPATDPTKNQESIEDRKTIKNQVSFLLESLESSHQTGQLSDTVSSSNFGERGTRGGPPSRLTLESDVQDDSGLDRRQVCRDDSISVVVDEGEGASQTREEHQSRNHGWAFNVANASRTETGEVKSFI